MGRLKQLKMAPASDAVITADHLARELVRADQVLFNLEHGLMPELAERWEDYAEDVRDWRYRVSRGRRVFDLHLCACGRVLHFTKFTHCFFCGNWYRKAKPHERA